MGYLFNLAPMGVVGGDLLKAWLLAREQHGHRAESVASIVVDRLIGLYMLLLWGIRSRAERVGTSTPTCAGSPKPRRRSALGTLGIGVLFAGTVTVSGGSMSADLALVGPPWSDWSWPCGAESPVFSGSSTLMSLFVHVLPPAYLIAGATRNGTELFPAFLGPQFGASTTVIPSSRKVLCSSSTTRWPSSV